MASSRLAPVVLLLLLCAAALVEARPRRCPGGKFARTPDKFRPANCRCGYRPGPGGGDCRKWGKNFCFPYLDQKLTCSSRVSFFIVDSGNGPKPQFSILRNYCDKGFSCTNRGAEGPWCCAI